MFGDTIDTIVELFIELLPMITIVSIVIVSFRVTDIFLNKKKIHIIKDLITFLFIIYIMLLYHVVTFQDVSYGANYIPFREMFRYDIGSKLFYKNIMGNLIMFIPYGFFIGHYLNSKKIRYVLFLSTLLSISIEITQRTIGRTFDVDDIILNVAGGLLGYYVYKIVERLIKVFK